MARPSIARRVMPLDIANKVIVLDPLNFAELVITLLYWPSTLTLPEFLKWP